jgi:hypothetical protein
MLISREMKRLTVFACLLLGNGAAFGFSLLGPYANWMQQTNGYRQPGDIGGPMDMGQGYRWNVPVVTYAFDKSFVDFFGSNGVAAVEGAIAILNALPPASSVAVSNFPAQVLRYNFAAQSQQLFDLKAATHALLLEHMGLGPATRNVFDLRQWDLAFLTHPDEASWPPGTIPNLVVERNFDPETLGPSHFVNGIHYSGQVQRAGSTWDVVEFALNPEDPGSSSVTDMQAGQSAGAYCSELTGDDVGGLRYLLNTNTVNLETLLPDVHGTGTNTGNFVNLALRPGIEKITFVRQEYFSSGQVVPLTNQFVDTYFTNNAAKHQLLERVITQPDFLFSVADSGNSQQMPYAHTGTSNWWNSAAIAGSTNETGPGVIAPPVKIAFDKRGPIVTTTDDFPDFASLDLYRWGSFDNSPTAPVNYPTGTEFEGANHLSIHLWLGKVNVGLQAHADWNVQVPLGGAAALQASTNLIDWVPITTVTNLTGSLSWYHWHKQPVRFFRLVPQ